MLLGWVFSLPAIGRLPEPHQLQIHGGSAAVSLILPSPNPRQIHPTPPRAARRLGKTVRHAKSSRCAHHRPAPVPKRARRTARQLRETFLGTPAVSRRNLQLHQLKQHALGRGVQHEVTQTLSAGKEERDASGGYFSSSPKMPSHSHYLFLI